MTCLILFYIISLHSQNVQNGAGIWTRLVQRSLPSPEIRGSNPIIVRFLTFFESTKMHQINWKDESFDLHFDLIWWTQRKCLPSASEIRSKFLRVRFLKINIQNNDWKISPLRKIFVFWVAEHFNQWKTVDVKSNFSFI